MKKYLSAFTIILLTIGLWILMNQKKKPLSIPVNKETSLNTKPLAKEHSPSCAILHQPKRVKSVEDSPIKHDTKVYTMYETLTIEEASLTIKPRSYVSPISAIHIEQQPTSTQKVGDTLSFPNIEGHDYSITISSIYHNNDGSTTTTGSYQDEGIQYTTTITQTQDESYINLSTAQGLYEMESSNNVGYVYRTDAIRKSMQDPNVNDFILLPPPNSSTQLNIE